MKEFKITPRISAGGLSHTLKAECPQELKHLLGQSDYKAKLQWKAGIMWITCEYIRKEKGTRNPEKSLPMILLPILILTPKLLKNFFIAQISWDEDPYIQAGTRYFFIYLVLQKLGIQAWEKSKWRILIEE